MNVIEINNLTKLYKNGRGVKNINLKVEKGQVYGLLGPNGSGKTTIMKAMTGLIFADSGEVKTFGYNPEKNMKESMRDVSCIIENPGIYMYLTAKQNLNIIKRMYESCTNIAVEDILEKFNLTPYANEKVENFSLGMKKKLSLAMTLLSNPQLIILDEPYNGLDIEGISDVRSIIKKQSKEGKTILISSHLSNEIEEVCTHVAIIYNGILLNSEKVPEIISKYNSIENYYLTIVNKEKEEK